MKLPWVSFLGCWAVWISVIQPAGAQITAAAEVTTFQQYYNRPREPALKGQPVRIEGTENQWRVVVRDNGKGIMPAKRRNHHV